MNGTCNLCGSTEWEDMGTRKNVRCVKCSSFERTRAIGLLLDHYEIPKKGSRILHFAPEEGLTRYLLDREPELYDAIDLDPRRYPHAQTRQFDATTDCEKLETEYYDLILHSHVLEHIPCTVAYVLFHLCRALKPDGFHIFCLPLMLGHYAEDYAPLSNEEATERFGQFDHMRRFARDDIHLHLGQLMTLDLDYSLYKTHAKEEIDAVNIPESERKGLNGSTIFVTRKDDYRLR